MNIEDLTDDFKQSLKHLFDYFYIYGDNLLYNYPRYSDIYSYYNNEIKTQLDKYDIQIYFGEKCIVYFMFEHVNITFIPICEKEDDTYNIGLKYTFTHKYPKIIDYLYKLINGVIERQFPSIIPYKLKQQLTTNLDTGEISIFEPCKHLYGLEIMNQILKKEPETDKMELWKNLFYINTVWLFKIITYNDIELSSNERFKIKMMSYDRYMKQLAELNKNCSCHNIM